MPHSLHHARRGFFGKIPSRGDFVRAGLSGDFVAPWDAWMQRVLTGSRLELGEEWVAAWMEAPIWRFLLQAGACGPDAALGVFMPSTDRAGRLFPLTLAWTAPHGASFAGQDTTWLDTAEKSGLAAIEHDLTPDALMAALQVQAETMAAAPTPIAAKAACLWWTDGSPRVPAVSWATESLPNTAAFTRMIDAGPTHGAAPAAQEQ